MSYVASTPSPRMLRMLPAVFPRLLCTLEYRNPIPYDFIFLQKAMALTIQNVLP